MATKTTAGTKAGTKTGFKQDVGFQRNVNRTLEESRMTLNTGGGEPIPAGHKRTHEYRVLQPRDPETGRFDYNSSANISRKYDYHAERNGSHGGEGGGGDRKTLPYFARGWLAKYAEEGVKKGDIIGGDYPDYQRYISTMNLTPEQFREQIENYLDDENGGTHMGNDYNWMKLGGSMSGGSETGDNKESSLKHFKNAVEKRTAAYKADPHGHKLIPRFAPSDNKHRPKADTPKSGPSTPTTPTTPTTPKAPKPTAPKPSAPSASKPEAPKSTASGKFGDISDAKNYPGKYLSEHKDLVNKMVSSLKASGVDATPDAVVSAISESSPEELDEIAAELGL
jgi:hypothetical protein